MTMIIPQRRYYSARNSSDPNSVQLPFDAARSLFESCFKQLRAEGYWDEALGWWCVDQEDVAGKVGADVANYVLLRTRRYLWPIEAHSLDYDEADLFDMIEFLHDHVSKPMTGQMHTYANCGMHWDTFDQAAGQADFRAAINPMLECYAPGYELNGGGEIATLAPNGLDKLLQASPPMHDAPARQRMDAAIARFQRYGSSIEDRRLAVRDLADVLEKLRPQVKAALSRDDEADLFNLANNFGIRHFNGKQKTDYDTAVWLSWMFYFYLATINACLHILERKNR